MAQSLFPILFMLSILQILPSTIATPTLLSRADPSTLSINDTLISLPEPVSATKPECFVQPRIPPAPKFMPLTRADCLEVIYNIVSESGADQPIFWDTKQQRFPISFGHKTCGVALYASSPGGFDLFSELDVAHAAGLILAECNGYLPRGGIGGRIPIGTKHVFWVAVAGISPRQDS